MKLPSWRTSLIWAYALITPTLMVLTVAVIIAILAHSLITNFEAWIPLLGFIGYWIVVAFLAGSLWTFLSLSGFAKR